MIALTLAARMEEAPRRRLARVAAQLAGAASTAPSPIPPAETPPSLRSRLVMAAGHDSVASMRSFFEEEGYLLFPRFLTEEHVARITADMEEI